MLRISYYDLMIAKLTELATQIVKKRDFLQMQKQSMLIEESTSEICELDAKENVMKVQSVHEYAKEWGNLCL